ncbi:protein-L-isoaspartate(D-aspartate) O-methyltransferase [Novipirellula artificiosorum]|uniref:Protein-L-isoaspartate O-methyltransferase n=1 Tax=Novipirellula artificiosorum TaxID=2528016 RepID=A0A5C6DNT7_9BACT|nr:protein-L-isoaspartate(D-aspartate) O-methyltransferase [Novipirellula artificiosorum]TWU38388.1 Protein-L-isoaspartate O-methyltransferase [Novipirellula artificiosorum]
MSTDPHDDAASLHRTDVASADFYREARERMVENQLARRDIVNPAILDAMKSVPRHEFVPTKLRRLAYDDSPLPIGKGQTISQPYIVALMTQLVAPESHHKALDIGTGSGYQAAVLSELVKNVYSIEIVESLADAADERLQQLGYKNIRVRHGDGYHGWQSEAPFHVIIVAAAPDHIPKALIEQLAPGGKLVIPVGKDYQKLIVVEKQQDGTVVQREIAPVVFVPMTGEASK